jgi:hypothetical protein
MECNQQSKGNAFLPPSGKVNVVYKSLWLRGGWAALAAEARRLQMEGDRLVGDCVPWFL